MPIFDCDLNVDPICPYCGAAQSDAWEIDMNDGEEKEIDCQSCALTFTVVASVSIHYSAKPLDSDKIRECCIENDLSIPDCVK